MFNAFHLTDVKDGFLEGVQMMNSGSFVSPSSLALCSIINAQKTQLLGKKRTKMKIEH